MRLQRVTLVETSVAPDFNSLVLRYLARTASPNPALGKPGGSCQVQQRIRAVPRLSDKWKDFLVGRHQKEEKWDNREERAVWPDEKSIGKAGFYFPEIVLRSHAQHRMDLRKISIADLKAAFVG